MHRFVEVTRRKAVPKGSLTVQDVKRSQLQLLKWSQLYIDVQHVDEKLMAKADDEGLIRAHGRLENAGNLAERNENPAERHKKPCRAAQRPSNSYPALLSPVPETRTLRLQELDARRKTKVLDWGSGK